MEMDDWFTVNVSSPYFRNIDDMQNFAFGKEMSPL